MESYDNDNLTGKRIFGLDIFRAIAILLVVKGHGAFLLKDTFLDKISSVRIIDGVDLFFVLSGFLIGTILLKEINNGFRFGVRELIHFWKRRWFRTLPNYYLILAVNYLIVCYGLLLNDTHDISQFNWKFLFFLHNFSSPFQGFFWESWSLSVEEWFYIICPILLIIALRFFKPKKSFIIVTTMMIVFPFLFRILKSDYSIEEYFYYDITFRKVVLTRLDSIAFGLLASWIAYYYKSYWIKSKKYTFAIGIGLVFFILMYSIPRNTFYNQVILFSLSPIAAMLMLPLASSTIATKGLHVKIITHISKISYSMYLLNFGIIAEVIRSNFSPKGEIDAVLKYILFWILVLVGSTILYSYFERPILKLRDKKISV